MTASLSTALILAAGKGTRMHSDRPKVLQQLLGEPMLRYVYAALAPVFEDRVLTVVGFGADQVRDTFPDRAETFVHQAEQLGTGHAVQVAWEAVAATGAAGCLVINGDTPLIAPQTVEAFMEVVAEQPEEPDLVFMTITPDDPASFGRVIRDETGKVRAIVEAKDFDPASHGEATGEVNAGIYWLRLESMQPLLGRLSNANKSGEYYITDLVDLAVAEGLQVQGVHCGNDVSLMGINSPRELVVAEEILRMRIVDAHLERGVLIHRPDQAVVGPGVRLEPGARLHGPCELLGDTSVDRGAEVESHCRIMDSQLAPDCRVRSFSHLEEAIVGPDCVVGPYARLRPGAVLMAGAKVGNFVEIKKSLLGEGAKASHLTYLGDAEIGAGANIGAGTITCNYDGKNKFRTVVGEGAFIGSNTALVAPVTVGKDALVGAGSTITRDVPDESAGIARAKQVIINRRLKKS